MKKIVLLTTVMLTTLFVSCNDDDVTPLGPDTTVVGFSSNATTKIYVNDIPSVELDLPKVTLISYANDQLPTEDITLEWEIVDPTTLGLTPEELEDYALPGVEYDVPATGNTGQVTIVAGQTYIDMPSITFHPIELIIGEPKKIIVSLTSITSGTVAYQYKDVVVTINGACASNLEGNYILNSGGGQPATFTKEGTGYYSVACIYLPENIWVGGSTITYHLTDVCGNITVDDYIVGGAYHLIGSGVVNPDNSVTVTLSLEGTAFTDLTGTYTPN